MKLKNLFVLLLITSILVSCSNSRKPKLIVKLVVDETQGRLGNNGMPVTMPLGNAGQSPLFNSISAHYLELSQSASTQLGEGTVLYHAPETSRGGEDAIDFRKAEVVEPNMARNTSVSLDAGTYEWVRLSLSYQRYDIVFHYNDQPYSATFASFVGFMQYIKDFEIDGKVVEVENKKQGFWAFNSIAGLQTGQTLEGATTVLTHYQRHHLYLQVLA